MSRKYKFRDQNANYFVTFATVHWIDVFTRPIYKHIMVDAFNHCINSKGLIVNGWCLMSNHVHMIISSKDGKLEAVMRDLKTYTSKKLFTAVAENNKESRREWILEIMKKAGIKNGNNTRHQFWQQNNHPIVLNSTYRFKQKLSYIHNNPVVAEIVTEAEDYLYSSARDYVGTNGLVEVTLAC